MTIDFRPLSEALGAEVIGVNVADDHSNETIAEIREGWLRHNILLFRGQDLTIERQKAFAQRFGKFKISPQSSPRIPEHPEVGVFSNIKVDGEYIGSPPANVGEGWHSDHFFLKEPAGGSFFYAKEAPEKGFSLSTRLAPYIWRKPDGAMGSSALIAMNREIRSGSGGARHRRRYRRPT